MERSQLKCNDSKRMFNSTRTKILRGKWLLAETAINNKFIPLNKQNANTKYNFLSYNNNEHTEDKYKC